MKHYVYRILLLSVIMEIGSSMSLCCGKRSAEIEELYKKIGEELIGIRKEFVQAQPKIYLVLDQLDKMYGIAKTGLQRKKEIKHKLKQKETELIVLKKEYEKNKQDLLVAQQVCTNSQQALNEVSQKFDQEKQQSLLLASEKNKLVDRIKQIAENGRRNTDEKQVLAQADSADQQLQSLTRNSISDPISSH